MKCKSASVRHADTSGFKSTLYLNQATQDAGWPDLLHLPTIKHQLRVIDLKFFRFLNIPEAPNEFPPREMISWGEEMKKGPQEMGFLGEEIKICPKKMIFWWKEMKIFPQEMVFLGEEIKICPKKMVFWGKEMKIFPQEMTFLGEEMKKCPYFFIS